MQKGLYDYPIKMSVSTFTGYFQIHGQDFRLDQSMSVSEEDFQTCRFY
jgi:hypothetical protein